MSIQRGPQEGIQPFQLSRAGPVVQRKTVVHDHNNTDCDQEPRDDDRNQHEGSDNVRKRHQEHSHRIRYGVVDGIDVLGKPVHDSPKRGGLEETHGSVHDCGDCLTMDGFRREEREETDDRSGSKERDGQGGSQSGINAHLTKYVRISNFRKRDEIAYVESGRLVELFFLPEHEPITGHDLSALRQHERE